MQSIRIRANRTRADRRVGGFTLIEVMVVVVIIGILGALIVPNVISRPDQARVVAARNDIQQIAGALAQYRLDNGFYPSNDQGLEALVERPSGDPEPRNYPPQPYLNKVPVDPWGEPYYYVIEGTSIEVYSFGADTREGGEGYEADIFLSQI